MAKNDKELAVELAGIAITNSHDSCRSKSVEEIWQGCYKAIKNSDRGKIEKSGTPVGPKLEKRRYALSHDKQGLLAYFGKGTIGFYHVHSDELTELERWIKKLLEEKEENNG